MFKNLLEEFHSLLKSDGLQTQTEKLKSSNKFLLVLFLFLSALSVNATDYYVSNSGNDSNPGTSPEQAWKTLDKVNSFTPSPGDKILFKRGDEWVGTINVNASGRLGSNIVYGAYGTGGKPKIYGSEAISGWTLHSGNIYKTTFSKNIEQVFIDDTRKLTLARYPNSGYFDITKVNSSTQFTCSSLNGGFNYRGATWIGRTSAYTFYNKKVTSSSSQTLTLESSPKLGLGVGEGFILTNKLEFLDKAGEWFYDASSKTLYLWTPNGDSPNNHVVHGAYLKYGVDVSSKNHIIIKDLNICHAAHSGINVSNSDYLSVDNNNIYGADQFGIHNPTSASNKISITNNIINEIAGTGIKSYSPGAVITGNIISDIGLLSNFGKEVPGQNTGTGIFTRENNMTIQYNRIINVGYDGINFWGANTMVKYNFIDNAMATLSDGGGIYTYNGSNYSATASAGSEIMHNIVLNCQGNRDGYKDNYDAGVGIYMDDGIHDIKIQYNTVNNCNVGIELHLNGKIDVHYNQISDCNVMMLTAGEHENSYWYSNVLYAYNETDDYVWWQNDHQRFVKEDGASAVYDNNTYINNYNKTKTFNNSSDWSGWQTSYRDANSTFNSSPLADGEYEKLFYNDTKNSKKISLGSTVYRDIYQNSVSGSITLKPFTSKILIKTSSESRSSNQNPSIQNQTFKTTGDLTLNEFIGQVAASDPDNGQTLTYAITNGNEEGLFYIDSATGEIYSSSDVQITQDKSIALNVEVTDDASEPLSASATITINITAAESTTEDTTAPTVSSFSIPSTSSTLTVSVSSFEASDDQSVAGYLLTEASTVPSVDNTNWTTTAPSEYIFAKDGKNVLYGWAKDVSGNISASVAASVTITLSDLSATFSSYLFEEPDGNIAVDSECSNDGTIMNEKLRVPGIKGSGLQVTGSGYVTMGQCYGVNVQNEVSLSTWIKPNATSTGYQGIIMHGGPNIDTYALYINPDYQKVAFKTTGTSSSWSYKDNVSKLWDGNWHHLVVTYDGAEKIVYLDNEVLLKAASTGSIESGEGYNLMVAAGRDETSPTLLYEGLIDEVRIYNYAISKTEVSELYNVSITDTVYKNENIYICDGESYEGWSEPGQYERSLQSSSGGDSIVTTHLYIYPTYDITEDITIKKGQSYYGWTESGQYQRTLTTLNGCDSVVTTNLTVLEPIYNSEDIEICDGESYEGWAESGQYQRTLEASTGADSIVTINLTVHPAFDITEDVTIKNGESYQAWTESGQYQRTLATLNGCDSVVTTNLTVLEPIYNSEDIEICDGESYEGWAESGQYQRTLEASTGADSIVTTNLTVNPSYDITEDVTIKDGESYEGWTESGQYQRTLTTVYGCDSLVTTNLAMLSADNSTTIYTEEDVNICNGESYEGWTETGQYKRILQSSIGEDSIVTTNLYVYPTYDIIEDITINEGESYEGWTESEQYQRTLTSVNGCDSMITTNLTVVPQSLYSEYKFEEQSGNNVIDSKGSNDGTILNEELRVNGYTGKGLQFTGMGYVALGQIYSNTQDEVTLSAWINPDELSGGYQGIIMHGGPNIDTYALYIYREAYRIGFKTTGTSSEWVDIDNVSTLWDGNWHHLAVTYNGEEKVIYLDSEVLLTVTASGAMESGEGYNLYIGAGRDQEPATLTYSGLIDEVHIHNYALTASEISDLFNTTSANQTIYTEEDITICEGEEYMGWTQSGQYKRTLESSAGGDSIVTTNLTVYSTYSIVEDITINEGESYKGWTESGLYTRTLKTINGCDSVVTTNLTVISVPSHYSEYLFEESYGSAVYDSKGSVDGIIHNEEIRINGVNGDGLEFTGSGYINLGQNYGSFQTEVTLSAWLRPDASARGNYQGVIMHGGPNIDTYALYLYPNKRRVGFKTTGTTEQWISIDDVNTLWDGNWHLLTVTYDGTEKVVYLDNTVILRIAASGKIESGEGYNLLIAAGRDDDKPKLLYDGQIDEVRIYNYALTGDDVQTLYNGVEGRKTKEGQISTSADFNNLENKNSFNFYPNPAINFITLEYSNHPEQNTFIQIMDASGRMVYNQKTESLTKRIDINNFQGGIYYIKSVNSKEQIVKKLIKR